MQTVPILSDVKNTEGTAGNKEDTGTNHLTPVTKMGDSSSKLTNLTFTGRNQHDNVSAQPDSPSLKTVQGTYSIELPLQQHNQHTLPTTNIEVTDKDLLDKGTKSPTEISSDSVSSNSANNKVSDGRNILNSKASEESSILINYKNLGGDDDEDSARWALEEVRQKLQTKPKGLKATTGLFNQSNKNGLYNKNLEKPLLDIQTNNETSGKSKGSDSSQPLNENLVSSNWTKTPNKNKKPPTNKYLKKHICSNCTNTLTEKAKMGPLEHSIKIPENGTNDSGAPVNNKPLAKPLLTHTKLRKKTTKMLTSSVPLNTKTVVQHLSVPNNPNQLTKMINSNITATRVSATNLRFNGNDTHHYDVSTEKESSMSALSPVIANGKRNISNSPAPAADLGRNDRKLVQLGNDTENLVKQENQTLKALNQLLKQSSKKVVLNAANVLEESNHSNSQAEGKLDSYLSFNETKAKPTKYFTFLKPTMQTFIASNQIHTTLNNKTVAVTTEKLSWNTKSKTDEGTQYKETVNSSKGNQIKPIKNKFEPEQFQNHGTKKPSMNFKPRNLSLLNNVEPKHSTTLALTGHTATPPAPGNSKQADAVEIVDDSSDSSLARISEQNSVTKVSIIPTSKKLDYGTKSYANKLKARYPSYPASYNPTKSNTKSQFSSSTTAPANYQFGPVKQDLSMPYQPTSGQIEQPSVSQNVAGTRYSDQILTNGIPLNSENWWGNSPSAYSGSVHSALPKKPYSSTLNHALYSNKYTNIGVSKRYGYRRNRRSFDLNDLSSEPTGKQTGSGSDYDVKPSSKGTIVIKLMPKTKNYNRNNTSNAGMLPAEQFSDHSHQNSRGEPHTNQSNSVETSSTPTSTVTLNLSNYQGIKDLQEDQEDTNKRKKQSDDLTSENGNLDLNFFHTASTPDAKIENDEDRTHQEISIQLGAPMRKGKNQEHLKTGNSYASQIIDDGKVITDLQKIVTQQDNIKAKAKPNGENKTQQPKNQQQNNSFQVQFKTQGKLGKTKENEDVRKETTDQENSSVVQGDAVAHVVIHDLSGKPVFKGKVNFFLPNHTQTNSVKNVRNFQGPQTHASNASNDARANKANDASFQEDNNKLRGDGTYDYQFKNKEHYSDASLFKGKIPENIGKIPSEENTSNGFEKNPTRQRKEKYKGPIYGNEINKKKEPKHNETNSIEITDFNSGKYPKDDPTPNVSIPLIEKELNKEIDMNDQLMITENAIGNDSFDSKKENDLKDEQRETHSNDGHTKTIKGIKSVTISLQKGNESIPIMQQLADPLQSNGEHPTFQVTTSSMSDDSLSSGAGGNANETPSLSLTVTTDESNTSNRTRDKASKGNEEISVHPSRGNGKLEDKWEEQNSFNSTANKNRKDNPDKYLIYMKNFQEQNHQKEASKTKHPQTNQAMKNKLVKFGAKFLEGFKSKLSPYSPKLKLPEEQKISIVNEKQKLVIPLALAQEYEHAANDQTLSEQANLQNDLAFQADALISEKSGSQATNVVTVGDPLAHKWVNCQATPSTKGDGSLTILNCDKKNPSYSQELEAGVDPRLPPEQRLNYLQGLSGIRAQPMRTGLFGLPSIKRRPQPRLRTCKWIYICVRTRSRL